MNTDELRKAATVVYLVVDEKVAQDLADKLHWAADEIDRLRSVTNPQPPVTAG